MKNYNFFGEKLRNIFFFFFFITKVFYFVSNMNDDFHEASFKVYFVSLSQKLVILEFLPQFFFHFDNTETGYWFWFLLLNSGFRCTLV